MASYHLSVKTIKRSAGRSATATAAYRVGERIECQREGRIHDYTRKPGIEETFILTPRMPRIGRRICPASGTKSRPARPDATP